MVTLVAPAKLTLSLRVTGTRSDGYHLIDAEMVTLDLHDTLHLTPGGSGFEVVWEASAGAGAGAGVAPAHGGVDGAGGDLDNLVVKALVVVGRRAAVRLHKRVPAGAGLGGGSAAAAAVLRWAGVTDLGVAARLGADVPFCVVGGRARVQGVGELVEPLPCEARTLTLLTPPLHCSTPAVYRAWDDLGGPVGERGNDLEPAALAVEPDLARWRDRLGDATGLTPRLAGSGSTWFVEGAFPAQGHLVVRTVPAGWPGPPPDLTN